MASVVDRLRVPLAAAAAAAVLGACVTTSDGPAPPEESPTEAASFNVQLGATYLKQGRLELAKEKLEKALEQDPQLAVAHTYAGLLYDRLTEADKASYHYRRALSLDPDDSATLNLYGAFLCRRGQPLEAEEYFLAATRDPLYGTPEVAFTNAGVCLLREQELDRAEALFRRALNVNPRYADALWQMSRLSQERGLTLQARAFFQRFAEVGDMTPEALWLGVRIERALGDEQNAARYADRLLAEYPDSAEARALMESGWTGRS